MRRESQHPEWKATRHSPHLRGLPLRRHPEPELGYEPNDLWLEFPYDPTFLALTTPEVTPEVTPDVTPEVTPEVKRLQSAFTGENSRRELQDRLALRDDDHMRLTYLLPALAAAVIEMTAPDKPKSRLQKYRLTAAGQRLLSRSPSP